MKVVRVTLTGGPYMMRGRRARTRFSVRPNASSTQIWAAFASSRTLRSLCVGPLERGAGPKIDRPDKNGRKVSVYVGPLEMPLGQNHGAKIFL